MQEYAGGGDLFDKVEPDVGVGEDIAQTFFVQLIAGLRYIHAEGVSHRDIKPENILLDADGNIKICDFGLAALFRYNGRTRVLSTACGSPPYAAPEVPSSRIFCAACSRFQILGTYDGEQVDIWSAGIVLFTLLLGATPWSEPTGHDSLFRKFAKCKGNLTYEPWSKLSPAATDLLAGMLEIDPHRRFTVEQILQHAWVERFVEHRTPVMLAFCLLGQLKIDLSQDAPKHHLSLPSLSANTSNSEATTSHIEGSHYPLMPNEFLGDDPSLSQFQPNTQLLDALTQRARRFHDICPAESLTKFYSLFEPDDLQQLLTQQLEVLGFCYKLRNNDLTVSLVDQNKCQLVGQIQLHKMRQGIIQVDFSRKLGDPLSWRRFFRSVAVSCREAIYTG